MKNSIHISLRGKTAARAVRRSVHTCPQMIRPVWNSGCLFRICSNISAFLAQCNAKLSSRVLRARNGGVKSGVEKAVSPTIYSKSVAKSANFA